MPRLKRDFAVLALAWVCAAWPAAADPTPEATADPPQQDASLLPLLAPPRQDGPVVVHAAFELRDLNDIDEVAETFEFTGLLELSWKDPRQAFEPSAAADEKVFQGDYQFNELSTGWYPQVVLANESGPYQKSGVVLRIRPDGTSTLLETIDAVAETDLDMRRYPFDAHRLEAVFEVLGFDRDEVLLEVEPVSGSPSNGAIRIPQWTIAGLDTSIRNRAEPITGSRGVSSAFVMGIEVVRNSFYIRRLVSFPLAVIVLLSFSVFWMDRSSLGDRISVSFIGILTGVAYQLVMVDVMPPISYFTLMHAFLFVSFLTMCGTVVVNLVVGALDKKGSFERGDSIDRRCRWMFPLGYFGLVLGTFGAASLRL